PKLRRFPRLAVGGTRREGGRLRRRPGARDPAPPRSYPRAEASSCRCRVASPRPWTRSAVVGSRYPALRRCVGSCFHPSPVPVLTCVRLNSLFLLMLTVLLLLVLPPFPPPPPPP